MEPFTQRPVQSPSLEVLKANCATWSDLTTDPALSSRRLDKRPPFQPQLFWSYDPVKWEKLFNYFCEYDREVCDYQSNINRTEPKVNDFWKYCPVCQEEHCILCPFKILTYILQASQTAFHDFCCPMSLFRIGTYRRCEQLNRYTSKYV